MTHGITSSPVFLRPPSHVALNLTLAAIPVVLAFVIAAGAKSDLRQRGRVRWWLWSPLLLLWLAFLPNSCYLITEWRHFLDTVVTTPVYVQTFVHRSSTLTLLMVIGFYILYTGAGLWTFFLALWPIDRLTRRRLGAFHPVVQAALFLLCSLGVYLGLVWRFNSADVLHPHRLLGILHVLSLTLHSATLDLLLAAFAAVLWLLYFLFGVWMDGALWRVRHARGR